MNMTMDTRAVLDKADVAKITRASDAACEASCFGDGYDGREYRNAERRYVRLIRKLSGCNYVTCHMVEPNPLYKPAAYTVAFGRGIS